MEVAMPAGVKTEVRTYQMYVNGEWVESKSSKTFPVYDPATEEVIAQVPDSNADDVNRAVAAAKSAFEDGPWGSTTAQERGRVLFRLAEKIRQNAAQLAELEARNCGKPIVEAEYDINDVATCFEYYGGLATKILGYVNPVPDNAVSLSLKEPVGVAGQIIPWNYPLMMAAWKLAPALAAGCTCVLKPAEQTPITALEMANWLGDVGLPAGAVNSITGCEEGKAQEDHARPSGRPRYQDGGAGKQRAVWKSAILSGYRQEGRQAGCWWRTRSEVCERLVRRAHDFL